MMPQTQNPNFLRDTKKIQEEIAKQVGSSGPISTHPEDMDAFVRSFIEGTN